MSKRQQTKFQKIVAAALRHEFKIHGYTTVKRATAAVVAAVTRGGLEEYFSYAEKLGFIQMKAGREITRQLKQVVDEETLRLRGFPRDLANIGRISACIALAEGPNAPWVEFIKATAEQWERNYRLKDHKAEQTQEAARIPLDIKKWLEDKGFNCLEDATFTKGE